MGDECEAWTFGVKTDSCYRLAGFNFHQDFKLVLRPFNSPLTEDEYKEMTDLMEFRSDGVHLTQIRCHSPRSFKWLLDHYIDCFGLIEAGLAIDESLKQNI